MEEFVSWRTIKGLSLIFGMREKFAFKSQLIDLAFREWMSLRNIVYQAAEEGVIQTQEELTTLIALRSLKAEAGHPLPPYNSLEYEDSELSAHEPGNVEIVEDSDDEIDSHLSDCVSSTHDSTGMTGEVSGPRQPTGEDIAARIQTGISVAF